LLRLRTYPRRSRHARTRTARRTGNTRLRSHLLHSHHLLALHLLYMLIHMHLNFFLTPYARYIEQRHMLLNMLLIVVHHMDRHIEPVH
jgi:ATP/ADP translocase